MHRQPLLDAVPPDSVKTVRELYAIADALAERAAERYSQLADRIDDDFWPVRCVFEVLVAREVDRVATIAEACVAATGRTPDAADLRWQPLDLVPQTEISDIGDSRLTTPYSAWALAVRHRQRAFVFWTYVIALAESADVRKAAEALAHEALIDGNRLRRERRIAWRAQRAAAAPIQDEPQSAALLESLLLRDMAAWAQDAAADERRALAQFGPAAVDLETATVDVPVDELKRRVLRRAEQISNLYLDDADRATDQASMELAQKLAAQSIMRLATLRDLAGDARG